MVFWSTKPKEDIKKELRDAESFVREDSLNLEKVPDADEDTTGTRPVMQDKSTGTDNGSIKLDKLRPVTQDSPIELYMLPTNKSHYKRHTRTPAPPVKDPDSVSVQSVVTNRWGVYSEPSITSASSQSRRLSSVRSTPENEEPKRMKEKPTARQWYAPREPETDEENENVGSIEMHQTAVGLRPHTRYLPTGSLSLRNQPSRGRRPTPPPHRTGPKRVIVPYPRLGR